VVILFLPETVRLTHEKMATDQSLQTELCPNISGCVESFGVLVYDKSIKLAKGF
jgi:hypothetical protein